MAAHARRPLLRQGSRLDSFHNFLAKVLFALIVICFLSYFIKKNQSHTIFQSRDLTFLAFTVQAKQIWQPELPPPKGHRSKKYLQKSKKLQHIMHRHTTIRSVSGIRDSLQTLSDYNHNAKHIPTKNTSQAKHGGSSEQSSSTDQRSTQKISTFKKRPNKPEGPSQTQEANAENSSFHSPQKADHSAQRKHQKNLTNDPAAASRPKENLYHKGFNKNTTRKRKSENPSLEDQLRTIEISIFNLENSITGAIAQTNDLHTPPNIKEIQQKTAKLKQVLRQSFSPITRSTDKPGAASPYVYDSETLRRLKCSKELQMDAPRQAKIRKSEHNLEMDDENEGILQTYPEQRRDLAILEPQIRNLVQEVQSQAAQFAQTVETPDGKALSIMANTNVKIVGMVQKFFECAGSYMVHQDLENQIMRKTQIENFQKLDTKIDSSVQGLKTEFLGIRNTIAKQGEEYAERLDSRFAELLAAVKPNPPQPRTYASAALQNLPNQQGGIRETLNIRHCFFREYFLHVNPVDSIATSSKTVIISSMHELHVDEKISFENNKIIESHIGRICARRRFPAPLIYIRCKGNRLLVEARQQSHTQELIEHWGHLDGFKISLNVKRFMPLILIINNISKPDNPHLLAWEIIQQNHIPGITITDLQLSSILTNKQDTESCNATFIASPNFVKAIHTMGCRFSYKEGRHQFLDYTTLQTCNRCSSMEHTTNRCVSETMVCPICADPHPLHACELKNASFSERQVHSVCIHCKEGNHAPHASKDSTLCPTYRSKLLIKYQKVNWCDQDFFISSNPYPNRKPIVCYGQPIHTSEEFFTREVWEAYNQPPLDSWGTQQNGDGN